MKLSICCITHNHGRYIAAALDSFLAQQVSFDYEIVIGEDCSTDDTLAVINAYKSAWGDRIRVIHHAQNIGMMQNFITTVKACRGEYIAFCEGDDYWTDTRKLAKQVHFLEHHPDYCITYHNCFNHLPNGTLERNDLLPKQDHSYSIETLKVDGFMPTMSVVFRNKSDMYFPGWLSQAAIGDLPFFLLYARAGKIRYFSAAMSAYRIHAGGTWTSRSEIARVNALLFVLDHLEKEDFSEKAISQLRLLRANKLAQAFTHLLFRGSIPEYQEFIQNPRYGYTRYQQQSRLLLRLKYLRQSKTYKRLSRLF